MQRLRQLLGQREFQVIAFCVSLLLFSWPLVSWSDLQHIDRAFFYLFTCWTLVILLQFLISRCVDSSENSDDNKPSEL